MKRTSPKPIRNMKDTSAKYSTTIVIINHRNILIIIIAMSGYTSAIVALAKDIALFTINNNNMILRNRENRLLFVIMCKFIQSTIATCFSDFSLNFTLIKHFVRRKCNYNLQTPPLVITFYPILSFFKNKNQPKQFQLSPIDHLNAVVVIPSRRPFIHLSCSLSSSLCERDEAFQK